MKLTPGIEAGFKSQFTATKIGRRNWKVAVPLTYCSKIGVSRGRFSWYERNVVTVPVGQITDLASIPRLLWLIIPPDGSYTPAAAVHDYIYRERKVKISRYHGDLIFLEAMKHCGTWGIVRYPMFWIVRIFGWMNYKRRIL